MLTCAVGGVNVSEAACAENEKRFAANTWDYTVGKHSLAHFRVYTHPITPVDLVKLGPRCFSYFFLQQRCYWYARDAIHSHLTPKRTGNNLENASKRKWKKKTRRVWNTYIVGLKHIHCLHINAQYAHTHTHNHHPETGRLVYLSIPPRYFGTSSTFINQYLRPAQRAVAKARTFK